MWGRAYLIDVRQALTQRQAISGLGGIGKTQIAVEYAYRYRDTYQGVFWVYAATRENIIASFLEFAALLDLLQSGEQDMRVAAVKQWFIMHDNWLLIFDNADDLTLAEEFSPASDRGCILLTTRDQAVATLATGLTVEPLDTDKGTLLLLRRAKLVPPGAPLDQAKPTDRNQAERIVKMMGGLPLALDQAAAYIEETGCSLVSYLEQYQQQTKFLQRRGRTSKAHPLPVASTWSLSFAQVEQKNPAAADLLRVCAFLAPDVIPEELLGEGALELGKQLTGLIYQPAPSEEPRLWLEGLPYQQIHLDEAIGVLRQFSLVHRSSEEHTLSIHRLVQAVLQLDMDEQTRKIWAERVIRAVGQTVASLEKASSTVEKNTHNYYYIDLMRERLLPHAFLCAKLIEEYALVLPESARLLDQTGSYLRERTKYTEAEQCLKRALAIHEQIAGPNSPQSAQYLNNLAYLCYKQGRFTEAEQLYRRALVIKEQVHASNYHSLYRWKGGALQLLFKHEIPAIKPLSLAISLNNLAVLYCSQGKYTEAEPLYQRALAIRVQVQFFYHPGTTRSLNNLAGLYESQEKYAEAKQLYQGYLRLNKGEFGESHPRTQALQRNYERLQKKMSQQGKT